MNNRVRYTRQNIISNNFYQLPKFLFDAEFSNLSNDARVLYSLLRNRHEISIKNEWYDENGEVFLYFKREDMQTILGLSENTIAKAMKDLKAYSLIEEERQGFGKPNKIYLLSATFQTLGIEATEHSTANFEVMDEIPKNQQSRNSCGTRTADFTAQEPQNSRLYKSHKNKIQNDVICNPVLSGQSEKMDGQEKDTNSYISQKTEKYYELIKENISYDDLAISRPHDMKLVDEILVIIIDTIMTEGKTVRIGGEDKPRQLVTSVLMKLAYEDIEHTIDQFKNITERISKKKQYILTTLYNCKMELDSHYTNLVKHGMWNGGTC